MKKPTLQATEKQFQQAIVDLAHATGWMVYHTYDSRRSAKGFPDLVLCHPKRGDLYFFEVKSQTGKTTKEQDNWLEALQNAQQAACVVRPNDWDWIEATLKAKYR